MTNQKPLTRKQYQHCIDTENSFYHMYILEPIESKRNLSYEEVLKVLKELG